MQATARAAPRATRCPARSPGSKSSMPITPRGSAHQPRTPLTDKSPTDSRSRATGQTRLHNRFRAYFRYIRTMTSRSSASRQLISGNFLPHAYPQAVFIQFTPKQRILSAQPTRATAAVQLCRHKKTAGPLRQFSIKQQPVRKLGTSRPHNETTNEESRSRRSRPAPAPLFLRITARATYRRHAAARPARRALRPAEYPAAPPRGRGRA